MPASRKPRKAYRPRPVNRLSHVSTIMGVGLLTLDDRSIWALALDAAITEVARGTATKDHWDEIISAVSLVEELIRMGRADDPSDLVPAAEQAIVDILQRRKEGILAVRASELAALRSLMEGWIRLLEGITHAEKYQAEQRLKLRKSSPHNRKVPNVPDSLVRR